MKNKTQSLITTLAVLATTSVPAPAADAIPTNLLHTAARTAAQICPCAATAGDLVGDVAARLWAHHRGALARGIPRAYVEASVRNAWRDRLRRKRPTSFSELSDGSAGVPAEPTDTTAAPPISTICAAEFRDQLKPADRDVLNRLETGMKDREIAQVLGRTRHSIRSSVRRLRRLADRYFG